jgi:hypothetical protein
MREVREKACPKGKTTEIKRISVLESSHVFSKVQQDQKTDPTTGERDLGGRAD